jgi:hypothetical protein
MWIVRTNVMKLVLSKFSVSLFPLNHLFNLAKASLMKFWKCYSLQWYIMIFVSSAKGENWQCGVDCLYMWGKTGDHVWNPNKLHALQHSSLNRFYNWNWRFNIYSLCFINIVQFKPLFNLDLPSIKFIFDSNMDWFIQLKVRAR